MSSREQHYFDCLHEIRARLSRLSFLAGQTVHLSAGTARELYQLVDNGMNPKPPEEGLGPFGSLHSSQCGPAPESGSVSEHDKPKHSEFLELAFQCVSKAYSKPRDTFADDNGYIVYIRKWLTMAYSLLQHETGRLDIGGYVDEVKRQLEPATCAIHHNSENVEKFWTAEPAREYPWWGWCKVCGASWCKKSPTDPT